MKTSERIVLGASVLAIAIISIMYLTNAQADKEELPQTTEVEESYDPVSLSNRLLNGWEKQYDEYIENGGKEIPYPRKAIEYMKWYSELEPGTMIYPEPGQDIQAARRWVSLYIIQQKRKNERRQELIQLLYGR